MRASIQGESVDYKQGKRKKEGVFYTPEYVTRYIVEHAIGNWLEERKQELRFGQLPELTVQDYESIKHTKTGFKWNKRIEAHVNFWEAYKTKLMNITILDPACGSGAFLNQAFDFLYKEGQRVNETLASFRQGQTEIFDLDKHILSNNIYGVDLNNESVEITKLSLWLKTANKSSSLTALDDNIKCGNSLIENPLIAGEKAFKWEHEFSKIMQKGGFDVIIGNPPYVVLSSFSDTEFKYLQQKYSTAFGRLNTFALFVEHITTLMRNQAKCGIIIPDSLCLIDYYTNLRKYLLAWIIHEFRHEGTKTRRKAICEES